MLKKSAIRKTAAKTLACFMSIVLILGTGAWPSSVLKAFADDAKPTGAQQVADPEAAHDAVGFAESGSHASGVIAAQSSALVPGGISPAQDGNQNYAVLQNGTLTFYYGQPTGTAGTDYYEGFDTAGYTTPEGHPWSGPQVQNVVFDSSVNGHLKPTSTAWWFAGCSNLTSINGWENLDTSDVTTMEGMFHYCSSLTALDLSRFNTQKVTTFRMMFNNCGALTSLDLSSFDTDAATTFSDMFASCASLTSITFGDNFTVANATALDRVFLYCKSLTSIDLTKWDTSKATAMNEMFYGCSSLAQLDLSSFSTQKVTRFDGMFNGCAMLSSIRLGEDFACKGANNQYARYWALVPTPPGTSPNNGLWWKGSGTMSYTPAGMQELSGNDIAGTWTWSEGVAVVVTSGEGGTATATAPNTGQTDSTVALTATPDEGYEFTGWTITSGEGTGTLSSATASSATFTLGAKNGAVKANFINSAYKNGRVQFSKLEFVSADRKYDPTTGALYEKDDAETARTTAFSLAANGTRVKAKDASGSEVPVVVLDGTSLLIQDEATKLIEGAKYTFEISVNDPVFSTTAFDGQNSFAATQEVEVTLGKVTDELTPLGRIGAKDVEVKAFSRGRAEIHYTNPSMADMAFFLYDASGNLVGEDSLKGRVAEGVISLPFAEAGSYTLCAVERSVYGALAKSGDNDAIVPDTLSKLENLGFAQGQLAKQTFSVESNKLTDVGVKSPFAFPETAKDGIVDRDNSSVTVTSSYSDYATISITVALRDGADASALDKRGAYAPKLRIYTNQKQAHESTVLQSVWPRSLSINGKPVDVLGLQSGSWLMTDGWCTLDLSELYPQFAGADSFPLTVSLTVPRSDRARMQASAYLVLNGNANDTYFVGSYEKVADEVSLVAPEVVADKTFTVQGFAAAQAEITLYKDGVRAATATADEYGYYATTITLPEDAQDGDIFDMQAVATWNREGDVRSASSEVLDVTYSTSRASLKRLWMFLQNGGENASWNYVRVYDNGKWSSMYKGYAAGSNAGDAWKNRRFVWVAEFNNAEYATNVRCNVPRNGDELSLPMTRDLGEADAWLSLNNPGSSWHAISAQTSTTLDSLGLQGILSNGTAAELFQGSLQGGNAFVSEPVSLTYAPSGVYVTYDDVERQTLPESDEYTGFSGLNENDVKTYIDALNGNSKHMLIVEEGLVDGKLKKVDSTTAAHALVTAQPGQVDRWIAVAFNHEPDTQEALSNPVWMQLHHTVETTAVDMGEPVGMISKVQGKYDEYLTNIAAAIEAGKAASDAITYCPCKEATNATGGIPIVDMFACSDDDPASVRYFVWTEDSNRNSYIRFMERLEVAGSDAEVYRQYEVDERQLVITEWNGQTRQKKVITYRIADSFVNGLDGGQHDTDIVFLANLWAFVGEQLQLGAIEAQKALVMSGNMQQSDVIFGTPRLTTQSGTGNDLVDNAVNGLGGSVRWFYEGAENNVKSVSKCVMNELGYLGAGLKQTAEEWGFEFDDGGLTDDELKSLTLFASKNGRGSCLWMAAQADKSDQNGKDKVITPYTDNALKVLRGLFKRGAYDTTKNAFDKGPSIVEDGLVKTVASELESMGTEKTLEGYRNYVYDRKFGTEKKSKYSYEYYRVVKGIFDYQEKLKEKNINLNDCGGIDWSAIPDDLYYSLKYTKDARTERMKRARSTGSIWPKGKHDPSGMVYEGMLSNPVEGATVTLYEFNPNSTDSDHAMQVDATKFGYEPNPQTTGADGRYQWFVNVGYWQVRVHKDGYEDVSTGSSDTYGIGATKTLRFDSEGNAVAIADNTATTYTADTYWMPVLPEQIDVNIPLVSTAAPQIESVEGTAGGVLVTFSKPLKVDTVSADMFGLQVASKDQQYGASFTPAKIEPVDADVAADGSTDANDKPQQLARTFALSYPADKMLGPGTYTANVAFMAATGKALSYVGTAADTGSKESGEFAVTGEFTAEPVSGNFTYNGAKQEPSVVVKDKNTGNALQKSTDFTVSYEKDGAAVASPTDAGTYTVYVTGTGAYSEAGKMSAGTFAIAQRPATVTAANQSVFINKQINTAVSKATLTGAVSGHSLKSVTLSANTSSATTSGKITPSAAVIQNSAGANVTANYRITYKTGTLTVIDHYTVRYNLNGGTGLAAAQNTNAAGRVTLNNGKAISRTGYTFTGWNTAANGRGTSYAAGKAYTFAGNVTLYAQWAVAPKPKPTPTPTTPTTPTTPSAPAVQKVTMHRMYNPNSGEHFYTASTQERDTLTPIGWHYEGIAWIAPATSKSPVYRMYNPNSGDHHYTLSSQERDWLVGLGWNYEGIGWYSDDAKGTPLYRQFNPNAVIGTHNYTYSKDENDFLVSLGWRAEGIGWYGVK